MYLLLYAVLFLPAVYSAVILSLIFFGNKHND